MKFRSEIIAMLIGMIVPCTVVATPSDRRPPMNEDRFWKLVDQAARAVPGHGVNAADRQAAALEAALVKLSPDVASGEVVGWFHTHPTTKAEGYSFSRPQPRRHSLYTGESDGARGYRDA